MTNEELKERIKELLDGNSKGKYFVHRTETNPVYYDVSTGETYTCMEFLELLKNPETKKHAEEDLYPFGDMEINKLLNDHFLDIGAGWKISEEDYKKAVESNFRSEVAKYFQNGLYAVETSIDRTATPLEKVSGEELTIEEQRERLGEILGEDGFGMNDTKKNPELGMVANRENLNLLLLLEVPEECFESVEKIKPLFEKSDNPFTYTTAYRGVQTMETIIPREYIKGAFFAAEDGEIFYTDNSSFDINKKVEKGIYDGYAMDANIETLNRQETVNSDQIRRILEIVKSNYSIDNDRSIAEKEIKDIYNLLAKVDNFDDIYEIEQSLDEFAYSMKTPFEKEYSDIENLDFSSMSKDEVANRIQRFVLMGSENLRNTLENPTSYYNNLELYENGIDIIQKYILKELKHDYRANNASAMVGWKARDIAKLNKLLNEYEQKSWDGDLSEEDTIARNELTEKIEEARKRICEDRITSLEKDAFLGRIIDETEVATSSQEISKEAQIIKGINKENEGREEKKEQDKNDIDV